MTSREKILQAIGRTTDASPSAGLPSWDPGVGPTDLIDFYKAAVSRAGGECVDGAAAEPRSFIHERFPHAQVVVSLDPRFNGNMDIQSVPTPHDLKTVDVAIIPTSLGVAENAAHWLDDSIVHRVLPFIAQHLVLLLRREHIVATMHEAYRNIQPGSIGFGVFVAGPSKTADIEQSLVIGAHGPRSLTVILF